VAPAGPKGGNALPVLNKSGRSPKNQILSPLYLKIFLDSSVPLGYKFYMPRGGEFFCINRLCTDFGKRGRGNIVLLNHYGKGQVRLLKCRTCSSRFSERRFGFSFGLHTEETKVGEVIRYLLEGMSFREAAARAGIDKDTVNRIWKKFVLYCEESLDGLVTEYNLSLEDVITLLHKRRKK
jgi:hypothetical protein